MSKSLTQSFYFIDSTLPELDTLLAGLPPYAKVVLLEPDQSGLQQVLTALDGYTNLDAVHVLTHGAPGSIELGNSTLNSESLSEASDALQALGTHLNEDADLLFYGCDVAGNDAGKTLIEQISALTGADVAASDDLTGAAELGGDWELEASVGVIDTTGISAFDFDATLALPGARSVTQGGEVFLGGNYLELGISSTGSFGTVGSKPAGFFGTSQDNRVGMGNDADGFGSGQDLRIDYFMPGSTEERWSIGYNGSQYGGFSKLNGNSGNATSLTDITLTDTSSGDNLSVTFAATISNTLRVEQTHSFGVDDKFFKTTVTLTNITGSTLTDVRYMRSFDPDNTVYQGGSYTTINKIENTYAEDGKAVVSATSMPDSYSDKAGDTAKILYFSSDPRAYVANFGFSNSNPYAAPEQPKGYTTTSDSAIAIVFKGGTLAPGASVTFEKASSLDTADISETVAAIEAASNPAPTFTAFDAPVETSDEDTQVEITFNELAARGNEADQEPIPEDELTEGGPTLREGTVDAFVVTSVKSGTLKIGTDAASATAWNPGTNDVIDATHRAYWTPAPNANNAENASQPIDAFDVKARDSDGLLSSSHVTAQINVTAVNDAPVIASASTNITLAAINEDQALDSINGATVSELVGPRFTDVDAGAQMGGIIIIDDTSTPDQGVWRYTTDGTNWHDIDAVASNSGLALAPTTKLAFFPTANWNGTPGGLVIRVTDEQYVGGYTAGASRVVETDAEASGVSANSINIVTTVNVDNDLPIFTSTEGAASLLETTGWDDAVSVDTGALTGVLSGTDQEDVTENGGSVGFTIRGGTLTGDVVTKSGFYGSLSLDTTTNKWTYTPGNFTAINALAAGATAVDTFEFKVFDSDGGSSIQRLDITLNGTNDLPVLAAVLSDQSFEGGGSFSWQIPADAFTDAEGIDLNYSVETVTDASGETVSGDGSLPAGLSFDEASRTFSGNPNADGTYFIKVTATDSAGAVVSDVFQLDLSNVGNQGPQVAAAVAPQLVLAAQEVTEVVFDAALGGQTLTFGGHTVTLGSAVDAATVASAVLAAGNTDNYAVAPKEGTSDTLVFTAAAAGDKLDTSYEDVVTIGSFNGSATVTKVKDGDTAQPESFILTLDDGAGTETSGLAGQTVIFDGTTVTLVDTDASGTVEASEIAEQISGQTFDNWIVAKVDGQNAVRFESTAGDQNLEDILDSDFSGTLKSNGIWETQLTVTDGNDGLEVFEVQYSGGYSGSTLTFDGVTATAGTAVSAADVASTVISASDNFAAHSATAKDGATDTVVFTADTAGESADITAESFTGTYINSGTGTPTVTITTIGRDWAFQLPAGTFVDPEGDALTYEAQLDGSPLSDTAALTFDAATATFSGDGSALPSGVLTVIATDSVSGLSASTSINLSLGNTADTGVTAGTAITDPSWNGDGHFSFQVPADAFAYSEGDTDGNALSYNATLTDGSALPAWLSIDPVTGTLSGNPVHDVPSTLDIKVTATDSNGTESSASQTFTLVLANTNDSPSTTTYLPDVTVNAGESISLDVGDNLFQDPDGHISGDGTAGATDATSGITYSAQVSDGQGGWQALPAWLNFDPDTHVLSGNPPAGTPYLDIRIVGTDAAGDAAFTSFKLNMASGAAAAAAPNDTGTLGAITDDNGGAVALGDVLTAPEPSDGDGFTASEVLYQWQVRDRIDTEPDTYGEWVDIAGADAKTFTVTQAESSSQIRVQAFYTDNGGYAEAPVSDALTVPALNVAGTAVMTGSPSPGETLVVTLSDSNGLAKATPVYQWYRSDDAAGETNKVAVGSNSSAYTVTNDDGGKYLSVSISYTDDEGTAETAAATSTQIQLGTVAPVAVDDADTATEAGGLDNSTPGTNATGNLFANDTDANADDTQTLTTVRSGDKEGLGTVGLLAGNEYVITGSHGTLRVNKDTGEYTYTVNQFGWSVETLQAGETLTDSFNYTLTDASNLSDTAVLTIEIEGANDAPSARDLPDSVTVVEDALTAIPFSTPFGMTDLDSDGTFTVKLSAFAGKLSGASGDAGAGTVTVTGSESSTLTLTGALNAINTWLNAADQLYYTGAPNANGEGADTLTLTAADDNGSGNITLGTVVVDITAANDAPILDLNADNSLADGVVQNDALSAGADLLGNDHAVVFRPRGEAVNIIDSDVLITDIDGDATLVGATAEITAGDWDNSFTIYETLSSTVGSSYVGASGTITITGNGTGESGLVGATKLNLSGEASHADYQSVLQSIQYNNTLDSAFAGNRAITISVLDQATGDGGLTSNAASFTIDVGNGAITVGQKIYIDGADSGHTVAEVIDSTHFTASGPLIGLADGATLSFTLDGSTVTTATAKADLATGAYVASSATSMVQVLWTPVVDLNGSTAEGTNHSTNFTEGNPGTYIATSNAQVTDQDGNLNTQTVQLTNAQDGAAETLFMGATQVANLANNQITTTFYDADDNAINNGDPGVHKIVFSGDKDATFFQQGLRAVLYKNTSDNPDITPREVTVNIVDAANNTGVPASTTIGITPVNDAPVKGGDTAGELDEGSVYVFTSADLSSTDVDNDNGTLKYVLTSTPAQGTLFRDTNSNGVADEGEAIATVGASDSVGAINAIGTDGYVTQAEVDAGQIKYAHNGQNPDGINPTGADSFGFKVVDGMEDYAFADIAANQAGDVTLTITETDDAPTGEPVITGEMTPGEVLTADVSGIADADGPDNLIFSYQWQTFNGTAWDNVGTDAANYTLEAADQGKQVRVQVSFDDALGRTNTLNGEATGTVAFTNTAATGPVTIADDGTPQPGETLTADTSAIADADGLGPFSYQWQVSTDNGATWVPVEGATAKAYSLPTDAAEGAQYKVAVSFTDGRGNAEALESGVTTVQAPDATVDVAPWLTATGENPTLIDGSQVLFSDVVADTVEDGQLITQLTLTVTGLADGPDEQLRVDGEAIGLTDTNTGTTATGAIGYAVAVTVTGTTATVTLTHSGLTEAEAGALVSNLAYVNSKNDGAEPPASTATAGLRVVTLVSLQDTGTGDNTGLIGLSSTQDVGDSLSAEPSSNTAPVAAGDLNGVVNEGESVTLTLTDLNGTDTEQSGLGVQLTSDTTHGVLFRDTNGNGTADAGEALTAGSTFTLADIDAGRIQYQHDGSETTADSFSFHISDGLALSDAGTFNIAVNPMDDAPTLTVTAAGTSSAPVSFTEGDASAAMLFSGANADPIEADENITGLTVMVSGLKDGTAEHLVVDGASLALTDGTTGITTTNEVGYSVVVTGGTAMVTLSKDADEATWNSLIDGLAYQNTSENPTEGSRTVTLTKVTETGDNSTDVAITSHVSVSAVNDAPTLVANGFTVAEGGSKTLTTTDIVAADVDDALNTLTYTLASVPDSGTVYIDANGNGAQDIGEALITGESFSHSQLNAGKVRYQHNDDETDDRLALSVSDPDAASANATLDITRTAFNDAPEIRGLNTDILGYPANSGAQTLEQDGDVVINDPDSANFDGGKLQVSITFNRDPANDLLSIKNIGTSAGQISVDGSNVSYAGTIIGTFAGGSGTNDLVVTFNTNATQAAVAALVEAIQFTNDQENPVNTSRTVSFALSDGDGGQSQPAAVNVNIATGVTPSISIANGFFVVENSQQVTALSAVDPNGRPITFSISGVDDGANNPDSGLFEIVSGNLLRFKGAPDFENPTDSGADNVYNVIVRATNDEGSYAEQALAVTVLDQEPEDAAVGDTNGPAFGFATVNGNSLVMTYTDASPLASANLPPASAFGVNVNGSVVAVNTVSVDATAKTVTLTLASAVQAGQTVTVSYTDPTAADDAIALQDSAGNDAPSLVDASVSNITPSTGGGGTRPVPQPEPEPEPEPKPEPEPEPKPELPDESEWGDMPDDDGDGIPETVEDFVPSIGGTTIGDGNGDGVADSSQQDVASVPFRDTPLPSQETNAEPIFVSLIGGSSNGKTTYSGTKLANVQQLDKPDEAPDELNMPLGLISFDANIEEIGATETFSLYVDDSVTVNGYWKQNAAGEWVNLASAEYGGNIVLESGKLRLDFTLTDGGEFDADGIANGVIKDPGALGFGSDTLSEQVQALYIAYYQRPADSAGLVYWTDYLAEHNGNTEAMVDAFAQSEESRALYGDITDTSVNGFIGDLYQALFDRSADATGMAFYANAFIDGAYQDGRPATAGTLMLDILQGAQGDDAKAIFNKLEAAQTFTWLLDPDADGNVLATFDATDLNSVRMWLQDITAEAGAPGIGDTHSLIRNDVAEAGEPITLVGAGGVHELVF